MKDLLLNIFPTLSISISKNVHLYHCSYLFFINSRYFIDFHLLLQFHFPSRIYRKRSSYISITRGRSLAVTSLASAAAIGPACLRRRWWGSAEAIAIVIHKLKSLSVCLFPVSDLMTAWCDFAFDSEYWFAHFSLSLFCYRIISFGISYVCSPISTAYMCDRTYSYIFLFSLISN